MEKKKTTPYLPSELIIEILLRLPVKYLIRFKSVCKSWFTLISNPNFANSRFQIPAPQTRKILSISAIPPQIRSIDFEALFNDHCASANPNLSLPQSYFPLQIIGSCRGFICLNCSRCNLLWNPSTGFSKKLPLSPVNDNFSCYLYGFGYDQLRDDYLMVSLSYDDKRVGDNSSHLEIFSIRDNTWKEIVEPTFRYKSAYNFSKLGLVFNGAIHWFLYRRDSLVNVIIAFDLMERKLLEMLLPDDFIPYLAFADFDLWVFGEFLSLFAMRDGIVEIWVMREYKVHSSWTKTLVFPMGAIPFFSPIYSTKNGDIFGTIGGTGLVKYNGKGQLLGHCSYCEDPRGSQVIMYTESLLSLPDDNKERKFKKTTQTRRMRFLQQSEEVSCGREGTAMEKKKMTPYLPPELIIEIQLRLPVKFLLRFKSVCKSWFTLISNPNFANSHYRYSSATQTRRILSISVIPPQIRSLDFEALLNDHSTSANPNLSLPQSYFPLQIRGSCRGFILLNCSRYNLLWNPTTGFCKKLPLSPVNYNFSCYLYGFGYDQLRDDYLLVSLSYDDRRVGDNSSHLEIFSIRDNTWKEIEEPTFRYKSAYNFSKLGLVFNGAIHWFLYRCDSLVNVIIAFDLMGRKLLEMLLPDDFIPYLACADFDLWVFGEFLSLFAMRDGIVEIWVMREYKVHSSWTKTLVFPMGAIPFFSPIYSTKNGDIFGTIGGTGLVKYNGKGQLLGHCSYCEDPRGSQVIMYTESLLSLPDDHEQV